MHWKTKNRISCIFYCCSHCIEQFFLWFTMMAYEQHRDFLAIVVSRCIALQRHWSPSWSPSLQLWDTVCSTCHRFRFFCWSYCLWRLWCVYYVCLSLFMEFIMGVLCLKFMCTLFLFYEVCYVFFNIFSVYCVLRVLLILKLIFLFLIADFCRLISCFFSSLFLIIDFIVIYFTFLY